jgi:ketosteroid isomerase-like protein
VSLEDVQTVRRAYEAFNRREFIDAGDWVVAIGTVSGHGGASGLEFSMRFVHLLEMRDGKVVRAYDVAGMVV